MNSRLLISSLVLMTVSLMGFGQTIRRVNNNGLTGTNIYSTIQDAHDAASDGDLIYIEGTKSSYGGFVCTKQLIFIGTGYFLMENGPMQALANESLINGGVEFDAGSSGSILYGVNINFIGLSSYASTSTRVKVSNITISRCRIEHSINVESGLSNVLISQSIIFGNVSSGTNVSNLTIANNILSSAVNLTNTTSGQLVNNVFTYEVGNMGSIYNCILSNNIMASMSTISLNNNTFSNNIGIGPQFPAGNGNQQNVAMADVFVVDATAGPYLDSRWKLKAGSPAIGAGIGGVDCGAYGGATPYVLSGIPPYPTVSSFITSGIGSAATPLTVIIDTKGND